MVRLRVWPRDHTPTRRRKTFGASCRQRLKRAAEREVCGPLESRLRQCDSGFFYRDAEGDAVCGLCGRESRRARANGSMSPLRRCSRLRSGRRGPKCDATWPMFLCGAETDAVEREVSHIGAVFGSESGRIVMMTSPLA